MARAFPQPHLPDPSPSPISAWQRQGTGDWVRTEQIGSFPSIWPSQSSRRASPELSTWPKPTHSSTGCGLTPPSIASDPESCDPPSPSTHYLRWLWPVPLWLRPTGGGAWAFVLSQIPEERSGQPLPSCPPPGPGPLGAPLKGCRPGCASWGSNRPCGCRDLILYVSGVHKPGILGNDLQVKCRVLDVHLDDLIPSAAELLS